MSGGETGEIRPRPKPVQLPLCSAKAGTGREAVADPA